MRFPMQMLATFIVLVACEKGAPLSNGTGNLAASPAAHRVDTAGPVVPAASGTSAAGAVTSAAGAVTSAAGAVAPPQVGGASAERAVISAKAVAEAVPSPAQPPTPNDEGNGEPMDDVDDEEVSATDKSGVDDVADETPSGPVDDSEGSDIKLRE